MLTNVRFLAVDMAGNATEAERLMVERLGDGGSRTTTSDSGSSAGCDDEADDDRRAGGLRGAGALAPFLTIQKRRAGDTRRFGTGDAGEKKTAGKAGLLHSSALSLFRLALACDHSKNKDVDVTSRASSDHIAILSDSVEIFEHPSKVWVGSWRWRRFLNYFHCLLGRAKELDALDGCGSFTFNVSGS